jgi:peptide deformylase
VLEIRIFGDPVLRRRAEEVEEIDDDLRALVERMFETMYAADGVGLAGPQVGVSKRVFVMDVRDDEVGAQAVINPVIVEASGSDRDEEGCLSVPGLSESVERARHVTMEARDPEGEAIRIEAEGLLARCIQHEIDHLDGLLFLDRVSPLKRKMLVRKWEKLQRENDTG